MNRVLSALTLVVALIGQSVATAPSADAASSIVGIGTVHGGFLSSAGWDHITADFVNMGDWAGRRVSFGGTFHDIFESEGANWFGNTDHKLETVWAAQATPFANLTISASSYSIARGDYDNAIRQWADRVKAWVNRGAGRSLFIAPLQEHNGNWVPYGCDAPNFRAAYARIRDLVRGQGLDETKVRWAWAPNGWTDYRTNIYNGLNCGNWTLGDYYPGGDIVDVIGYSAYRGQTGGTVYGVAGGVADQLRAIDASKPYLLAQTAAWPSTSKEQWIRDLFSWAEADPNMVGLIWFNFIKETDWRVWASPSGPGLSQGWKDGMSSPGTDYQWPLTDWFQNGPLPFTPVPLGELADRVAGSNRFATSVEISKDAFDRNTPIAYIATGYDFPDALAAAAAAGAQDGPVLLIPGDGVHDFTIAELQRLRPNRIVVVGGPSAISDHAFDVLSGIAPTDRLGGSNRYDTAALVALDAFDPGVPIAYVATGLSFPDALAAAAAGGAQGGPVLLTHPAYLPAETDAALKALQPQRIIVVGGENAVSGSVEAQLRGIADTDRIAGSDRFSTAAAIAEFASSPATVFVATGYSFPDALSGAAAAASQGVPLILTDTNSVPWPTGQYLSGRLPNRVVVLGGTSVITDYCSWQLKLAAG